MSKSIKYTDECLVRAYDAGNYAKAYSMQNVCLYMVPELVRRLEEAIEVIKDMDDGQVYIDYVVNKLEKPLGDE